MLGGQNYGDMAESPKRPGGGGAGWVVVLALVVAAGVWAARRYAGVESAASASAGGKPVLMMFTADWCGPCQSFKARTLSNPAVLEKLERSCRFQTVDLTNWNGKSAETAKQYGVTGVPTLILVRPGGREISRYPGPNDPQYFGRWLDQNAR